MLNLEFLNSLASGTKPYEIVVAFVIVIFTLVVLYFLYRNVSIELREWKKQKDAMLGRNQENKEKKKAEVSTENETLLQLIDKKIKNAKEGELAVFYAINMDDFKSVVEDLDKKQADKITSEIEKKLKKSAKKGDIVGNLREDEFIYYHIGEVNNETINEKANEILELIREPLKSVDAELTCSIGITIFPYDGSTAENLFKNAGLALYVAKKEGKNRSHLYSEELIEKEQFNISYYKEIKSSIENDEFLLYYQPIVDIKTGSIIGFESLLRWNHPTMGILPPGKFLNVMDLSGDITWFGTWGFEKIVKQYKIWRDKIKFRDLFISTNLSPKQLAIEGLAHQFFNITKKLEMPAELFCMEIIDYYSIVTNPIAVHNINEFRKFGFRIAVDDMGNKFEIINDMQILEAGMFKINRSNMQMILDRAEDSDRIHRVIDAAQKNQKIVIAEGIEDEEAIRKMVEWDVRFMQGYFFSEPVSIEDAEHMLKNSPWNMASFNHLTQKP